MYPISKKGGGKPARGPCWGHRGVRRNQRADPEGQADADAAKSGTRWGTGLRGPSKLPPQNNQAAAHGDAWAKRSDDAALQSRSARRAAPSRTGLGPGLRAGPAPASRPGHPCRRAAAALRARSSPTPGPGAPGRADLTRQPQGSLPLRRPPWTRGESRRGAGRGRRPHRGEGARGPGAAARGSRRDPGDPGPGPPPPPAHPDPSRVPGASPRPSHAGPPASFRNPAVCRAGGPRAALAQPAARQGPRPDPSGRAPPPRVTHLRPRPRPNAEAAAGWRGQAARPRRHSHLPFPRHSAHPPRSAREQPPRSSAAPKSKGVRLRHHNQMAEPPWPAAQPAHWALPPPPPPPLAVARRPSAAIGPGRCRSSAGPQIPPPRRSG